MMQINFLDPRLLPQVSCKAPVTDNYEPDNLISPNESIRNRGFLAYSVTKPPVELEFKLLCPANITRIVINPGVGRQKSTGIEIFARTTAEGGYISIAKALCDNGDNLLTFERSVNRRSDTTQTSRFYFKRDTLFTVSNASALKLVIFRTLDRSVPCLGSIKVIGSPSNKCSQVTVKTIERLMGLTNEQPDKHPSPSDIKQQNGDIVIPEDFKDDLTCDLMALPTTLPSGKTIDRATLERHVENEKSYGRPPGDPFTGLKFTEQRRPVLNVALKSRIDMFLLRNSDNPVTFTMRRTVGGDHAGHERGSDVKCGCGEQGLDCPLYSVGKCGHFLCRTCLFGKDQDGCYKCDECGAEFTRGDIERYHR